MMSFKHIAPCPLCRQHSGCRGHSPEAWVAGAEPKPQSDRSREQHRTAYDTLKARILSGEFIHRPAGSIFREWMKI